MAARERLKQQLADALRASRADHTEIRLQRTWASTLAWRGSRLEAATTALEVGGTVRCLNRGKGWGTASFTGFGDLRAMVSRAHELSLAVPLDAPIRLAEVPAREADFLADLDGDVRDVPLSDKRALVDRLAQEMLGGDRRLADSYCAYQDAVIERWVATSEGVMLYDIRPDVRFTAAAVAREDNLQGRGVESWAGRVGWRSISRLEQAPRTAGRRAVALLRAERVRPGTYPVVLDPRAMGTLIHQTVGHLSEADGPGAAPGDEPILAPGRRVGPDILTVGDDGSAAGLPGSFAFDDEGAPTQNTLLLQHGVVVGRLHTRATAARAGVRPSGNARAAGYGDSPSARITNLYVSNGRGTLEELIGGIAFGLYCCDALAGSLQQSRYALTTGYGYLIRDGRLAELVQPVVLAGDFTEMLRRVDAVAGDFSWSPLAAGCTRSGSGALAVADGAPHTRFEGLAVVGDAG
ncbi:MAG: TldD/PmbA family protein [Gemmatimonadota bacterium]|nr:TldD/PmbA family protein [Gemmatimonadota bacterium]